MKISKRFKSPVPRLIKKVQVITGIIGGLGTGITAIMAQYPQLHVPGWLWETIGSAAILNLIILQLTTKEDFHQ